MSSALDRQIKPIYDAIDSGSNKSALLTCNKLLKKTPNVAILKALKALALVRMQKVEESLVVCDEVLATKPTDDGTLSAMIHVLRALGRNNDTIKMFEEAYKKEPMNEDLAFQTFFSNARVGNWKAAQQVAAKMYKSFGQDRYLCWNVMSALLQARDPTTPANMRPILIQLAYRLLKSKDVHDLCQNQDRFHLWLTILLEADLLDEAETLVNSELGKVACDASLSCDELRRTVMQKRGHWEEEGKLARERIQERRDRNWLEFLSVIDATFAPLNAAKGDEEKNACAAAIDSARALFVEVAERDGSTDRSGLLAQLELQKRSQSQGIATESTSLVELMKEYIHRFGSKPCCFEDMKPYVASIDDEHEQWTSLLKNLPRTASNIDELQRLINLFKLERFGLTESQITAEAEETRALEYTTTYMNGLPYGSDLPDTETQPADDLAILAAHAHLNVHTATGKMEPLYSAVSLLEYGLTKSKHAFQMRLLLIRLYHVLTAPSLALEHYRALGIKQVQHDTLGHLVMSRASAWSLGATGDLTLMTEIMEASQIYLSNTQDTPDMITRAFQTEKYSQISDFLAFYERLEHSLQRNLSKIELIRMRMSHEEINQDFIDPELIELKFNFDRFYSDNRNFDILPNYQPKCQPSFLQQTELFHESQGSDWLLVFLKIYIRALQQGSDLSDVVEEKLLIGDRPKLSGDPENKRPLEERLLDRSDEERADLSAAEIAFYDYCAALGDWLGPHHDFCRPPAAEVLAKANKITQQKTGHSLKGYNPTTNGSSEGESRREEDAPPVKDAPSVSFEFFDNMHTSFKKAVENGSSTNALHVASITQEAVCMLTAQTFRFKDSSTVKMHKLGNMVQSIKDIRSTALEVLKIMSTELIAWGDREVNAEKRKAFLDATTTLQQSTSIPHDFVLNIAKKVTDARKKVLDGVGQGIVKVCKNHA